MEKEKFKALVRDLVPKLNDITQIMQEHNVTGIISLATDETGFFNINTCDPTLEARRGDFTCPVRICYEEVL